MTNTVKLLLIFGVFVAGVTTLAILSTSPSRNEAPPPPAASTEEPEETPTPSPEVEATEAPAYQGGSAATQPAPASRRSASDNGGTVVSEPDPGDFDPGEDAENPLDNEDGPYDDEGFPFGDG